MSDSNPPILIDLDDHGLEPSALITLEPDGVNILDQDDERQAPLLLDRPITPEKVFRVIPRPVGDSLPRVTVLSRDTPLKSDPVREPVATPRKPYHIRLQEYRAARERIFGSAVEYPDGPSLASPSRKMSRSTRRIRDFWKRVRENRRRLATARIQAPHDVRPYADVQLLGQSLWGLLDSGASVSILGKGAVKRLEKAGVSPVKYRSSVEVANGSKQEVVGHIDTDITFKGETKPLRLYVVPGLAQELYLGVDFWRLFGLAPDVLGPVGELATGSLPPPNPDAHILSPVEAQRLQSVKARFPSSAALGLGKTSLIQHVIDVGDATPIKQRHYPVSPAVQKLMDAELARMRSLGVIEESQSPWSSPVVLVRKPGKVRLCFDARKVNSVTKKDAYPLPQIDGILSRLPPANYITSLDLKDAFWQIPLDEKSREKTAFTVPGHPLYQFTVMPFGLCNAPQTMCRLMDQVIPPELRDYVQVYLDDLVILSDDFETHMQLLAKVADCLTKAGLTINVEKSKFCLKRTKYLGFIIGDGGIKTDPDKISAIVEYPAPRTTKQVRRFMGMAGWYRRFIPNFADLSAAITDTLRGKQKFEWTSEAQTAFVRLKEHLTSAPLLVSPDFDKPFIIQCDASQQGVGGVLLQLDDEGQERPIAYVSQKLNSAQRNYSITELECLAAVMSVKKFRPYVELMPFKIVTDHASLQWLMTQKDLSGRLARWSLKLQGFDFAIEHRKGSLNVVPDALSRIHCEELSGLDDCGLFIDLQSPQFASADYTSLRERIEKEQSRLPDLVVRDGFVYIRTCPRSGDPVQEEEAWKLWLPQGLTAEVIARAHDPPLSSHGGINKTLERIRRNFYWPKMAVDVRKYVLSCDTCRETKAPNTILRPPIETQPKSERPWQRVYMDLLGPYPRTKQGNVSILIILDHLSKFPLLTPLRQASTSRICKVVEEVLFHIFGVPEVIVTDNGTQFRAEQFKKLLDRHGVQHVRTALYSPQANASERVNRSILAGLRAYIKSDHTRWDEKLSNVASSLRSSIHQATGFSPYQVLFGNHMVTHASAYELLRRLQSLSEPIAVDTADKQALIRSRAQENLRQAFEKGSKTYNLRSRPVDFKVGQEVFHRNFPQSDFGKQRCAKFERKFIKCRVKARKGNALYELEDLQGRPIGIYHAKDIKQ